MDNLADAGISGALNEQLIDMLVEDDDVPRDMAISMVEDKKEMLTEATLHQIDALDAMRDSHITLARKAVDACPEGVLKLRAARHGRQLLATFCTSELMEFVERMAPVDGIEMVRVKWTADPQS